MMEDPVEGYLPSEESEEDISLAKAEQLHATLQQGGLADPALEAQIEEMQLAEIVEMPLPEQ